MIIKKITSKLPYNDVNSSQTLSIDKRNFSIDSVCFVRKWRICFTFGLCAFWLGAIFGFLKGCFYRIIDMKRYGFSYNGFQITKIETHLEGAGVYKF